MNWIIATSFKLFPKPRGSLTSSKITSLKYMKMIANKLFYHFVESLRFKDHFVESLLFKDYFVEKTMANTIN
jgi:hypothetical protein